MRRTQRLAARWLAALAWAACLMLAAAVPVAGGSASAASSPSPALVAAEAAPAVQLVVISYAATVLVPDQKNNLVAQHAGEAGVQAMAANGEIGSSLQALNDQWAKELASDPGKYNFAAKPVHAVRTSTTATCSGWFVTPTGYLVTAAHCVTKDATVDGDLAGNVLPRFISRSYRSTVARWERSSIPMDQTIHSQLRSYETKWYEENSAITHTSIKAVVALGVRGKNGQRSQRALPARIVSQGSPYPGEDFALLKVSGHGNLPTLGLGNANKLVVGDNLYIDGFPGSVTDSTIFTQQSRLEPTFTGGLLSAFRTTTKNVPYLQTQAPAYHGNSGGPVLDANGSVVGTLIAGAADPNTGQLVAGEQFALPATVIARELAGQGVRPETGTVTADYDAALRNYFTGYYTWALAGFHRVLAAFPDHPYAAQYARLAQQQIAAGHDRTPRGSFPWLAVVLLLAVAAIGGGLILRFRGRRARPPGHPAGWPPPAQPTAPQPTAPAGPGWPPPSWPPPPPAVGPRPAPPPSGPGWPAPPPPSVPDAPEADRPGPWPAPE